MVRDSKDTPESILKEGESRRDLRLRLTAQHIRFVDMRAAGEPLKSVARELEIPISTAKDWDRAFRLQIENVYREELEVLSHKYFAQQKKRLEVAGETVLRLKAELTQRDLKNLRDKDLLAMLKEYLEVVAECGFTGEHRTDEETEDQERLNRLLLKGSVRGIK